MITVKGVEVRPEEVAKEIKVSFKDLTEEGQKRIFRENKDEFIIDALKSKYSSVQNLIFEVKNECSSIALNKAIEEAIKRGASAKRIIDLLNVPTLELDEELRKLLSISIWTSLKKWVIQDKNTSFELLKSDQLFMYAAIELIQSHDSTLFDAIVKNPKFKWDEELERNIMDISPEGRKIIKARIEVLKYTD